MWILFDTWLDFHGFTEVTMMGFYCTSYNSDTDYIILLQNVEWVLGNLRKKSDEINALFAGKTIDRVLKKE